MYHQLAYCAACATIPRRKYELGGENNRNLSVVQDRSTAPQNAASIMTIQLSQHLPRTFSREVFKERGFIAEMLYQSACVLNVCHWCIHTAVCAFDHQRAALSFYIQKVALHEVCCYWEFICHLLRGVLLKNIIRLQAYVLVRVREHVVVFIVHFTHWLANQLQERHPR